MKTRESRARVRARAKPPTILVVDDEAGTVDVLHAVLSDAGYRVAGASNGREALEKMRASRPDLVLLDFVMPVLDGAETLRAIKQDARLSATPVIMMSGILESMIKRREKGYAAFLRKPFSLDELLAMIAKQLDR